MEAQYLCVEPKLVRELKENFGIRCHGHTVDGFELVI